MSPRPQEHRQIERAARQFRRDLKALQKEWGFQTEAELRRFLVDSDRPKAKVD